MLWYDYLRNLWFYLIDMQEFLHIKLQTAGQGSDFMYTCLCGRDTISAVVLWVVYWESYLAQGIKS